MRQLLLFTIFGKIVYHSLFFDPALIKVSKYVYGYVENYFEFRNLHE